MQKNRVKLLVKRFLILFGIMTVLSVIAVLIVNSYVEFYGEKYMKTIGDTTQSDAVIVLGAYVFQDGTVSDMLADRLNLGYEIYKTGKVSKILVSGDHGKTNYDEVNHMREYLEKKGVPRQDIFMDHAGFSTYDSMYRARDVFQIKKTTIVTQRFHLVRAIYIARKLGIEADGVNSDPYKYPGMNYYLMRELGSRFKAFLYSEIFKPEPKYLGKVIPIWKSGDETDDGKS